VKTNFSLFSHQSNVFARSPLDLHHSHNKLKKKQHFSTERLLSRF